jgi:hypothetical protein
MFREAGKSFGSFLFGQLIGLEPAPQKASGAGGIRLGAAGSE